MPGSASAKPSYLKSGFGNSDDAVEAMRYETLLLDQAPGCALARPDAFSDLFDCEEHRVDPANCVFLESNRARSSNRRRQV
jgi:hypothetical protein